jgi:sugar lactone lactonase YvrE
MQEFKQISKVDHGLPESVRYSEIDSRLSWVDIEQGSVSWVNSGSSLVGESAALPLISLALPLSRAEYLVAAGPYLAEFLNGEVVTISQPLLPPGKRFNDGCLDALGRLVIGTMDLVGVSKDNALLVIESDARIRVLDDDLGLSNGVVFDNASCRLFSVDSADAIIYVRDLDMSSGKYFERKQFFRFEGEMVPDGICLATNGDLLVSLWGSGLIAIIDPLGREMRRFSTPNLFNSSVALATDSQRLFLAAASSDRGSHRGDRSQPGAVWETVTDLLGMRPSDWNRVDIQLLRKEYP